jgi:hypothetical protein
MKHAARIGRMTNAYNFLARNPEEKTEIGRPKSRCDYNIMTNLKKI